MQVEREEMMQSNRALGHLACLGLLMVCSLTASAQVSLPANGGRSSHVEIVRGRVFSDGGTPVVSAQVAVTMGVEHISKVTRSGTDGRWELRFVEGTGDFLVHVSAEGYQSVRKRLTRGAPGQPGVQAPDSIFSWDIVLARVVAAQLPTIRVEARREHPQRRDDGRSSLGLEPSAEEDMSELAGALRPDEAGDLTARALTTSAVIPDGSGASAFGLGAAQTNATLGGLAFTGSGLPRDMATTAKVSTSPYDPSKGWFGGVQVAVEISPGGLYSSSRAHAAGSIPTWQLPTAGEDLGGRVRWLQASAGGDGSLLKDRYVYNIGLQVSRRTQAIPSLLNASPSALRAGGIDPKDAARLVDLLVAQGGSTQSSWLRPGRTDESSFAMRIDRPSFNLQTFRPEKIAYGVTMFGTTRSVTALGITPSVAPSTGGSAREYTAGIQGNYSTFLPNDWLLDIRSGLSSATRTSIPYVRGPGARVFVGVPGEVDSVATLPDSGVGGAELSFGGSGPLEAQSRSWLWETQGELRMVTSGKTRHSIAVTGDLRLDALHINRAVDRYGTYTFRSLNDLESSRPASFTRVLSSNPQRGGVWNAYLAVGDYWRVSPRLQVMYGARLEGNRFTSTPFYNQAIDETFGIATDRVPNSWALSPRVGFSWIRKSGHIVTVTGPLGTFPFHSFSVLRGGIGVFRDLLGPAVVSRALGASGLGADGAAMFCAGDAVPRFAWDDSTLPTSCAIAQNGPPSINDAAPQIIALAPSLTAPRSLRGNLAWSATRWNIAYTVDGTLSYNVDQPSQSDVNFAGIAQFVTATERRPIFVPASRIVTSSGIVDARAARIDDRFGQVLLLTSAGRSFSRQITWRATPVMSAASRWRASGAYTISQTSQRQSEYDGGAFEKPSASSWSRSDFDVRHRFLLQGGYSASHWTLTTIARILSGRPFTPLVGSDVNGDGMPNDRAYIYAPSSEGTEGPTGAGMASLVRSSSGRVSDCLLRQLERSALRNSCDGPWSSTLDARLDIRPRSVGSPHDVDIAISFANVLAGLDRVLHGNAARGWGAAPRIDPVLYRVASFEPATQNFVYDVNTNFGRPVRGDVLQRTPFRVAVDVQVSLGRPRSEQQFIRAMSIGRKGDRGKRLTVPELKARYARSVIDPYARIVAQADSLLLTRDQISALQNAAIQLRPHLDSIWTRLAESLSALDDDYDARHALKTQEDAIDAAWYRLRDDLQAVLPNVLAPAQLRLLPPLVSVLLSAKPGERLHIRVSGPG